MKKSILFILVMVLCATLVFSGCSGGEAPAGESAPASPDNAAAQEPSASEDAPVIGFSNYASISYFMDMGASANKTAKDAGAEFFELRHEGDPATQPGQIEDLIAKGAQILITEVTDDTSLVKQFAELKEKGITIVCCDIYTEGGDFWIASDNKQIGRTSAEEAVKYLEKKNGSPSGKVAILSSKTTTSMIGRAEGFKEVLEQYPDIEIVDEQFPTSFDAPSMMNLTDDMLQKYPTGELDIIFASNQTQLEGANSAIMTAGRQDVALFGVDDSDAIFEALQDENSSMMSTVVQDPIAMGAKAVEMGLKIHNGEAIDTDVFNPDVVLVTRDNVAEYIASKEAAVAELSDYYG